MCTFEDYGSRQINPAVSKYGLVVQIAEQEGGSKIGQNGWLFHSVYTMLVWVDHVNLKLDGELSRKSKKYTYMNIKCILTYHKSASKHNTQVRTPLPLLYAVDFHTYDYNIDNEGMHMSFTKTTMLVANRKLRIEYWSIILILK